MEKIRRLSKDEPIPYDLLLLADEYIEAVKKYVCDCEIYVFEKKNEIVAQYAFQQIDNDEMEIRNIAVATEFQGRGIGRRLLRDASDRARSRGFKAIIIGTGDVSTKQLHLYQTEDFKIVSVRKNFFVENYPKPILENGKELRDMIVLKKNLR